MQLIVYNKQKRFIILNKNIIARLNENESNIFLELASTSGDVTRQRLLDVGWPNTIVSSNSVNMAVRTIRSSTGLHDLILTKQGVGYTFNTQNYSIEYEVEQILKKTSQKKIQQKRCFLCYFILTFIIMIYISILISYPNVVCNMVSGAKVCSTNKLTKNELDELQLKFEILPNKEYYYGKINAYSEYALIEFE